MGKEELIETLEDMLKHWRTYFKDPKHSNEAGNVYILLNRLNNALDKV